MLRRKLVAAAATGILATGVANAGVITQNFDSPGSSYVGQKLPSPAFGVFPQNPGPAPTVNAGDANSDGQYLQLKDGTRRAFTTTAFDAVGTEAYSRIAGSFDFRLTCLGARTGFAGGGCADGFAFSFLDTAVYGASGQASSIVDGDIAISEGSDIARYSDGQPLRNGLSIGLAIFAPPPALNTGGFWVSDGDRGAGFIANNPGVDMVTGVNSSRGRFLSLNFDANFETDLLSLSVVDGASVTTVFDNADISFLGLDAYNSRLAFGTRSGDAGLFVDTDNINIRFTPQSPAAAVPLPATLPMFLSGLFLMRRLRYGAGSDA